MMADCKWQLLELLLPQNNSKFALVLLNQPFSDNEAVFQTLWEKAVFKAVADGATNRLYDSRANKKDYLPDIITGDFDSARPEVLQFYQDNGVELIPTPDQNATDFTKCLKTVLEKTAKQVDSILVLGAFGGRLDHVFGNINTLFLVQQLHPSVQVYLLGCQNMACLLPKGSHRLCVKSGLEGDSCGLIPMSGRCDCVTTTGLKWNLDGQALMFGELVSTSNTWSGDPEVTITTDNPILWTMNIQDPSNS